MHRVQILNEELKKRICSILKYCVLSDKKMNLKVGESIKIRNNLNEIIEGEVKYFNNFIINLKNSTNQTSNWNLGGFQISRDEILEITVIPRMRNNSKNDFQFVKESSRKNSITDSFEIDENSFRNMHNNIELESTINSVTTEEIDSNEMLVCFGYDYGTAECLLQVIAKEAKVISFSIYTKSNNQFDSLDRIVGIAFFYKNCKMPIFIDLITIANLEKETDSNYGSKFFKMFDKYLSDKRKIVFDNFKLIDEHLKSHYDIRLKNTADLSILRTAFRQVPNEKLTFEETLAKFLPQVPSIKINNNVNWFNRPLNETHNYLINRHVAYLIELKKAIALENESYSTSEEYFSKMNDSIMKSTSTVQAFSFLEDTSQKEKHSKISKNLKEYQNSTTNPPQLDYVPVVSFRKIPQSSTKYDTSMYRIVPSGFTSQSSSPKKKASRYY